MSKTAKLLLDYVRLPFFILGGGVQFVHAYTLTTISLLSIIHFLLRENVGLRGDNGLDNSYQLETLQAIEDDRGNPEQVAKMVTLRFKAYCKPPQEKPH